jgi:hypothetical protein
MDISQSGWSYVSHLHSFRICNSLQQNVRDNQNCQQEQVINQCYFCHHLPDPTSRRLSKCMATPAHLQRQKNTLHLIHLNTSDFMDIYNYICGSLNKQGD